MLFRGATYSCNGLTRAIENALQVEEDTYTILEAKPRAEKHKKAAPSGSRNS